MNDKEKNMLGEEDIDDVVGGNSFGWTKNCWDATECAKINKDNFNETGGRCKGGGLVVLPCDHYIKTRIGSVYRKNLLGETTTVEEAYNHKCGYGKFDFDGGNNGPLTSDKYWIK